MSLVTRQASAATVGAGVGPGGRAEAAAAAAAAAEAAARVPALSPFHTAADALATELDGSAKLIAALRSLVEKRATRDDQQHEVARLTSAVQTDLSAYTKAIAALEVRARETSLSLSLSRRALREVASGPPPPSRQAPRDCEQAEDRRSSSLEKRL